MELHRPYLRFQRQVTVDGGKEEHTGKRGNHGRLVGTPDPVVNIADAVVLSFPSFQHSQINLPCPSFSSQMRQCGEVGDATRRGG
jgi:hypothetical protein